jgi:peptidoglycan-associated lipoprotein
MRTVILSLAVLSLAACNEPGLTPGSASFGDAVQANEMAQLASLRRGQYLADAGVRFSAETRDTVHFAFNCVNLTAATRKLLDTQARWLSANPDIRMLVTGQTDLVGGETYNQKLGLRRAEAVTRDLLARGVERGRVEAVVSRGERDPVVVAAGREVENRRAVTSVAGFTHGFVGDPSDGRRARLMFQRYTTDPVEEPAAANSTTAGGS